MIFYKVINDRLVFSSCKAIQLNGVWVSNPSAEQIALAGWEVYVPPVIPPQPQTEPDYDQVIQAVKRMLSSDTEELTDEDALDVAALYPTWASKMGGQVSAGERLWYDGKLFRVLQAHTTRADWTPDKTPALYTEVSIEEWPAWKQPVGASDAYHSGDKVSHNGRHWSSDIDGNVWEPGVYGWTPAE